MARLDSFLTYLQQQQGSALILQSDAEPGVVIAGNLRAVTGQKLSSAQILVLINEITPSETLAEVNARQSAEHIYTSPVGPFLVKIVAKEKHFIVTMSPYQDTPAQTPPPFPREEPFDLEEETALFMEEPATSSYWEEDEEKETIQLGDSLKEEETIDLEEKGRPGVTTSLSEPAASREEEDREESAVAIEEGPEIEHLLRTLVERGGSDLHLGAGERPMVRKDGELLRLNGFPLLGPDDAEKLLLEITPQRSQKELKERHDTDFAYEMTGVGRFRVHLFRDRNGIAGVFRAIPVLNPMIESGALPPALQNLSLLSKGLVLVTGPTGSGKSTTLSALIDFINRKRTAHLITIENPIEFIHENKSGLIRQREIGTHTGSFAAALRAGLRQDPDIVVLGEMSDPETTSLALSAAESGRVVVGALDATSAASAVDKLIELFPPDRHVFLRSMLAETLKGATCQTLCRRTGGGRIAAVEVMIVTPPIASLIREGKAFQIPSLMKTGAAQGMVMLNDALLALVNEQVVAPQEAYMRAPDKNLFTEMLKKNGCDTSFLPEMEGRPAS